MIEPSVAGVLRSSYTIWRFYLLFFGALLATMVLAFVTAITVGQGWFREAALGVLANLAATLVVLMLIYGVWVIATPPGLRNAQVPILYLP